MIDNGNGTVTDEATGLMWQQETAQSLNWADSIRFCSEMTLGGYTDWRLPTVKELQSIVYHRECWLNCGIKKKTSITHIAFAIDARYFRDICCYDDEYFYISSSVFQEPGTKRKAWGVEFNHGKDFIGHMRFKHRFRACRDVYRAVQAKKEQLTLC
ncbi:MAG: DUF1566 domain-containing protein [Deltaproteobacteria bacterium]